jgi:hypothetical protein
MNLASVPDGPWSVLEGEYDGRPLVVRLNTGAAAVQKGARFAHRIGVAVAFLNPNVVGFPEVSERDALSGIEEDLCEALKAGTEVVQAVVITTGGMREFVFYCSAPAKVHSAVQSIRARYPSYEIQLIEENDPDWAVYEHFAGAR